MAASREIRKRVVLLEAGLFGEFEQLSFAMPLQPRVRHDLGQSDEGR